MTNSRSPLAILASMVVAALGRIRLGWLHRLESPVSGTKPNAVFREVRLENRLQHLI
jgi:hypothetical protein